MFFTAQIMSLPDIYKKYEIYISNYTQSLIFEQFIRISWHVTYICYSWKGNIRTKNDLRKIYVYEHNYMYIIFDFLSIIEINPIFISSSVTLVMIVYVLFCLYFIYLTLCSFINVMVRCYQLS